MYEASFWTGSWTATGPCTAFSRWADDLAHFCSCCPAILISECFEWIVLQQSSLEYRAPTVLEGLEFAEAYKTKGNTYFQVKQGVISLVHGE